MKVILNISKGYARYRQNLMQDFARALPEGTLLYHTSNMPRSALWELEADHPETTSYCHRTVPSLTWRSFVGRWERRPDFRSSQEALLLEELCPDLILIQEYSSLMLRYLLLAKMRGIPCIAFSDLGRSSQWEQYRKINRLVHQIAPSFVDGIVAQSGCARTPSFLTAPKPVLFVPHCINIETLQPPAQKQLPVDPFTLLLVGTYDPVKGHDLLAQALLTLPPSLREKLLVRVIGRGDESWAAAQYGSLVTDGVVQILGVRQGEELFDEFRRADAFVLPSRSDTFGVVIHEACAFGLPILASQYVGSVGVLVEDQQNGLVVDPYDAALFGEALSSFIEGRVDLKAFGSLSRKRARHYCTSSLGEELVEWLQGHRFL